MDAEQEFVEYVEKYPECYDIAQSGVFMKFLRAISETPQSITELVTKVQKVEMMDIRLIVLALESAKLVKKTINIQKEVYGLTPKGGELLEKYDAAKKGLK